MKQCGVGMAGLTPLDILQNVEHTECSLVQCQRLCILSWFRYVYVFSDTQVSGADPGVVRSNPLK